MYQPKLRAFSVTGGADAVRIERGRLAVFAAGMCAFFDMYVTQALLPQLRNEFHVGVAAVSLTVTVTTLAVAVAAPFAGGLSDRYGRKRVLVCAIALLTLSTFGAATAHSLRELLAWRALQGVFIPGLFASTVTYIAEEWGPRDSPTVASLYVGGTVFGSFCGRFLAGLVTAATNWRTAFLVLGVLSLCFLPLVAYLLPASRGFKPAASLRSSLNGAGRHLRNWRMLATYGVGFALLFSQVGTFTYLNFHLSAPPLNFSTHQLSFIFFVFLVGAVVTPFSGAWSVRRGARAVGLGALATSSFGLLLTLVPWLPLMILGLILTSGGIFIVQSMSNATVPRLARGASSTAVGLYVTSYYLGGSAGATLPAAVWSAAAWPGCVGMVLLVQAGAMLLIRRAWNGRERRAGEDLSAAAVPAAAPLPRP